MSWQQQQQLTASEPCSTGEKVQSTALVLVSQSPLAAHTWPVCKISFQTASKALASTDSGSDSACATTCDVPLEPVPCPSHQPSGVEHLEIFPEVSQPDRQPHPIGTHRHHQTRHGGLWSRCWQCHSPEPDQHHFHQLCFPSHHHLHLSVSH